MNDWRYIIYRRLKPFYQAFLQDQEQYQGTIVPVGLLFWWNLLSRGMNVDNIYIHKDIVFLPEKSWWQTVKSQPAWDKRLYPIPIMCRLVGFSKLAFFKNVEGARLQKFGQEAFAVEFILRVRNKDSGIGGRKLWHMYAREFRVCPNLIKTFVPIAPYQLWHIWAFRLLNMFITHT